MIITAFCYRNGDIHFGKRAGNGALRIARGPEDDVRRVITGTARMAYDGETLLVPGIPEADTEAEALIALARYIKWITPRIADLVASPSAAPGRA